MPLTIYSLASGGEWENTNLLVLLLLLTVISIAEIFQNPLSEEVKILTRPLNFKAAELFNSQI